MFKFCGDMHTLYAMGQNMNTNDAAHSSNCYANLVNLHAEAESNVYLSVDHPVYSKKKYMYIPKINGQQINLIWPKKINFIIFYSFLFIFRRRKKRSQKMKFYEAYKVTMYSMANELKCLM